MQMMKLVKGAMLAFAVLCATSANAKDIKVLVVKTTPEMQCNGCETKIKKNIRSVKGVTKIDTNRDAKTVSVTYDADKTDSKTIVAAFKKINFEATVVSDKKVEKKSHKIDGETGASQQMK